jgi:hypothetical protein
MRSPLESRTALDLLYDDSARKLPELLRFLIQLVLYVSFASMLLPLKV